MKNVRQHCFGSQSKLRLVNHKRKGTENISGGLQSGFHGGTDEDEEDNDHISACVSNCKFSYGTPIWQMFYSMMKETDKDTFYSQLDIFRKTCRAYNQSTLLDYFEKQYFTEDRIKQWARWYRFQMYDMEWLLDNNMHVEGWHNYLKSVLMKRLKNVRVDKLVRILIEAEMMIFWKWQRYQLGSTHRCKKGWAEMHGHLTLSSPVAGDVVVNHRHSQEPSCPLAPSEELKVSVRRSSYLDMIREKVSEISILLKRKKPTRDRQRTILTQVTRIRNVLRDEPTFQDDVVTKPEVVPVFPTCDDRSVVIKPVINQYHSFKRKSRKRTNVIRTNVRSLRGNETNRHNHFQSFELSLGMSSEPMRTTPLKSTTVVLKVKRTRGSITLGGITFMPTIGGIVIGENRICRV